MADDEVTRLPEDSGSEYSLTTGQMFGQFRIVRQLGRGGMGEVYEVEHAKLGTRHAIKLINQDIVERASVGERFEREAKVMANLRHPNIVHVDDYGETEGRSWLRMELVGGGSATSSDGEGRMADGESSLADLLTGEPLPEALVARLLKPILEGLAYAHDQGVVHRDLKPSNILLDLNHGGHGDTEADTDAAWNKSPCLRALRGKNITPKVTDFGLVRLAGEQWLQSQVQLTVAESAVSDPDATQMEDGSGSSAGTSTQAMLGTFEYMSPEQREGVEVDARSDLYSVGLIAFRMLTGQKVLGFDLPSKLVPGLDSGWDSWMRRSLAPALKDRFPDARAMLESLPGVGKTVCCTESRKRNLLWIAVIIVISALVGLGVFIGGDFDRESEEKASNALRINGNLGSASTADESKEPTQKQPAPQEDRVRPNNSVAVSENVFESTVAKEPMTPTAPRATLSKKVLAKAGEDYTFDLEAGVELEMVWVDRLNGWVGRYEITNSQYRVFRSDHRVSEHKGLSLGGSRQPVVNVNYGEVLSYLDWLNKRLHAELPEKYHFRLPDGDEWTHFSKCGDDRKYPWGNQWPPSFGNYAGELIAESLEGKQFHSHEVSAPVPESGKNLLGLYGVGGNVWEWTSESSLGGRQALRGGSWYVSEKEFLECEFRNMVSRSKRDFRVGFRVVLMP